MSVVDAAGYAMAPAEEFVAWTEEFQPEKALRNGHQAASRAVVMARTEPSTLQLRAEAWVLWLREIFGPWGGGRAAA